MYLKYSRWLDEPLWFENKSPASVLVVTGNAVYSAHENSHQASAIIRDPGLTCRWKNKQLSRHIMRERHTDGQK
jgi:hypothetical protein